MNGKAKFTAMLNANQDGRPSRQTSICRWRSRHLLINQPGNRQQVTGHNNHSDVVGEESAVPGEPSDFPDIPKSSRITLSTCAFSFSLATF